MNSNATKIVAWFLALGLLLSTVVWFLAIL